MVAARCVGEGSFAVLTLRRTCACASHAGAVRWLRLCGRRRTPRPRHAPGRRAGHRRPLFLLLVLCAFVGSTSSRVAVAEDASAADSVAERLASVREQKEVRLTTIGRRSGKPHTIPVWFMVDGPLVYLNTLDTTRDWVRNAQKNPEVRLDFGAFTLAGRLRAVTDERVDARARELLRGKY